MPLMLEDIVDYGSPRGTMYTDEQVLVFVAKAGVSLRRKAEKLYLANGSFSTLSQMEMVVERNYAEMLAAL